MPVRCVRAAVSSKEDTARRAVGIMIAECRPQRKILCYWENEGMKVCVCGVSFLNIDHTAGDPVTIAAL